MSNNKELFDRKDIPAIELSNLLKLLHLTLEL